MSKVKKAAQAVVVGAVAAKSAAKTASTSRDNRTVALAVVGAIAVAVGKHCGVDVRGLIESSGVSMEDAMALLSTGAGAVVIWYRERGRIRDEQDVVTPRPE